MKKRVPSLRAYLAKTGMTQEQLAAKLGITQAHFSMILNGQRKPSVDLALLIEEETGVSVRDVVAGGSAA